MASWKLKRKGTVGGRTVIGTTTSSMSIIASTGSKDKMNLEQYLNNGYAAELSGLRGIC